jgi:hypothetical protein
MLMHSNTLYYGRSFAARFRFGKKIKLARTFSQAEAV